MTQTSADIVKSLETLAKRQEFLSLAATGRKWVTPSFIVQADTAGSPEGTVRVGYTVTRKIGNAVVRNRCKRRLREVARAVLPGKAPDGWRYVLVGRQSTATWPFEKMIEDLEWAIRKLASGADKRAVAREKD